MLGKNKLTVRYFTWLFTILIVCWTFVSGVERDVVRLLKPGEESRGPWWMKQTSLTAEGKMASLKSKSWWKKVRELRTGEQLLWKEGKVEKENMLVRITQLKDKNGNQIEVLVWGVDDDEDGSLLTGGDFHDDCYIYDFFRDGRVDFMVDYADENKDGQADFMEIRFFNRGQLTGAWIAFDYDGLGEMIKISGPADLISSELEFNLSGNKAYYRVRYEPQKLGWLPDSLFPLASLDIDGNGLSDKLFRLNLKPATGPKQVFEEKIGYLPSGLNQVEVSSLELSFDVDHGNSAETPYHYDLGLVISSQVIYHLEESKSFSPLRRPPQELPLIPLERLESLVKEVKARDVFLSWKECHLPIENKVLILTEKESHGLGWSWERIKAPSSSPDVQKWNVRREAAEKLNGQPEFYYSELDRRIHLFKAKSGWWPLGYVAGLPRIGEIRYFDTDDDGYFDRLEIYLASSVRPVLIINGHNKKITRLPFDLEAISKFYNEEILSVTLKRNEKLSQAMAEVLPYQMTEEFRRALSISTGSDKRYLLDIYNLLSFVSLRDHYLSLVNQKLFQAGEPDISGRFYGDLYPGLFRKPGKVNQEINSEQAWKLAALISALEMAFSDGDEDKFINILKEIKKLKI
ncbi:MAG: hypothetical protein H5U07_09875 [Candidatus Aminicenantes bacterium]|nr:hypothetical protein [Candidatus Aminicenantes bacterium]